MPGPERAASSSVAWPISAAVGITPARRRRRSSVADACASSSATASGMNGRQQIGPALGAENEAGRSASRSSAHFSSALRRDEAPGGRAGALRSTSATSALQPARAVGSPPALVAGQAGDRAAGAATRAEGAEVAEDVAELGLEVAWSCSRARSRRAARSSAPRRARRSSTEKSIEARRVGAAAPPHDRSRFERERDVDLAQQVAVLLGVDVERSLLDEAFEQAQLAGVESGRQPVPGIAGLRDRRSRPRRSP